MGITGLLKGLTFCSRQGSVREFSGKSLAVDASSWLHKSVYSISEHYVEANERGKFDARCIDTSANYIVKRCQELTTFAQIGKIILVMDGKRCPLKSVTNQERERRRQTNLNDARRFKSQGQVKDSEEKYKACIKIGERFTKAVMARITRIAQQRRLPISFLWSPYEADAQLVRLCLDGKAHAIVTEVSNRHFVVVVSFSCHDLIYEMLYILLKQKPTTIKRILMLQYIWQRVTHRSPLFSSWIGHRAFVILSVWTGWSMAQAQEIRKRGERKARQKVAA